MIYSLNGHSLLSSLVAIELGCACISVQYIDSLGGEQPRVDFVRLSFIKWLPTTTTHTANRAHQICPSRSTKKSSKAESARCEAKAGLLLALQRARWKASDQSGAATARRQAEVAALIPNLPPRLSVDLSNRYPIPKRLPLPLNIENGTEMRSVSNL